ncbi:hypothetical protein TKK_0008469 [Trichogramma kaykai]
MIHGQSFCDEKSEALKFVEKTGYKDEPDRDKDEAPLLRRTTLVHTAFKRGCSADIVNSLFEKIYNRYDMNYISDDEATSNFHVACACGLFEDAQKFLDACDENGRRALLKLKNAEGNTALFLALKNRHLKLAEFLLENGASANVVNYRGLRPIHVVRQKKEFSALKKQGADPSRVDAQGSTPLHVLCKREAVDQDHDEFAIDWFLDICHKKVIDFDVKDKEGRRPLHFALGNGKYRTAELRL